MTKFIFAFLICFGSILSAEEKLSFLNIELGTFYAKYTNLAKEKGIEYKIIRSKDTPSNEFGDQIVFKGSFVKYISELWIGADGIGKVKAIAGKFHDSSDEHYDELKKYLKEKYKGSEFKGATPNQFSVNYINDGREVLIELTRDNKRYPIIRYVLTKDTKEEERRLKKAKEKIKTYTEL